MYVAISAGAPMAPLPEARLVAGRGIAGDRYTEGTGHYSAMRRTGDGLTLVDAGDLERIAAETGTRIDPSETRRNVVVRGPALELDELIGRTFRIGEVRCRGVRRAEPCTYLEGIVGRPILVPLVHRAGIRVDVLEDGTIRIGDGIVLDPD